MSHVPCPSCKPSIPRRNDSCSLSSSSFVTSSSSYLHLKSHSMEFASTLKQLQASQDTVADDALVPSADAISNDTALGSSPVLGAEPVVAPADPSTQTEAGNPIEASEDLHQEFRSEGKASSVLPKRSLNGQASRVSKSTRRVGSDVPLQTRSSSGMGNLAGPSYMRPTFASLSKRRTSSQ